MREKHKLKQQLTREFEIKELERLKYFLSIEMAYSNQGIFIGQQIYVLDLLKEIGKLGCKLASTLMNLNKKLGDAEEEPAFDKMFQKLVRKLIYLAHTRPDIS